MEDKVQNIESEQKNIDVEPIFFKCITCNYPDCIHLTCENK